MCVLLFDAFKHFLLKFTLRKLNSSERKFEEIYELWRAKRYQAYLGKHLLWYHYLRLSFVYKTVSQISFKLFCSGGKRLSSEFLRKWGWFQGHNERFRNILAKNQNFKKLRQDFVDERVLITTTLTSSCHWETLVPFCLRKKKPKNAFLTLNSLVIVSYCKIVQKNKLALQSNNKLAI